MKSKSLGVLLSFLFLQSCGLETVSYLPPPLSASAYLSQISGLQQLTANFDPSVYSNVTGFQGYEIYYKIYPVSTANTSTNLAADANLLNVTPTRDYLITMGYQRMNGSNSQSTVPPLIRLNTSSATTITLDFSLLTGTPPLQSQLGNVPGSPLPTVVLGSGTTIPVFRTVNASGVTVFPYFNELFLPWSSRTADMSVSVVSSTTPYEVDVFLVSYAFTLEQVTYSQPVPWGVLEPLAVAR